jgi:hypothetical protein
MKISFESRAMNFLLRSHSANVPKISTFLVCRKITPGRFEQHKLSVRVFLLTLLFLAPGKLLISLMFLSYPQMWIILFVSCLGCFLQHKSRT